MKRLENHFLDMNATLIYTQLYVAVRNVHFLDRFPVQKMNLKRTRKLIRINPIIFGPLRVCARAHHSV